MSKTVPGGGRKRRRLAPSEKYEIYLSVVTKQATQREAAAQWGVDRSTVTHICKVAKQGSLDALAANLPGRRGMSAEQVALEAAQAEIDRLKSTVTEQAVSLHLVEGKSLWD
jgi:transposase-like protein